MTVKLTMPSPVSRMLSAMPLIAAGVDGHVLGQLRQVGDEGEMGEALLAAAARRGDEIAGGEVAMQREGAVLPRPPIRPARPVVKVKPSRAAWVPRIRTASPMVKSSTASPFKSASGRAASCGPRRR